MSALLRVEKRAVGEFEATFPCSHRDRDTEGGGWRQGGVEKRGSYDVVDETEAINKKYRSFAMRGMDEKIFFQRPTVYWTCFAHVNNAAVLSEARAPLFLQTLGGS